MKTMKKKLKKEQKKLKDTTPEQQEVDLNKAMNLEKPAKAGRGSKRKLSRRQKQDAWERKNRR